MSVLSYAKRVANRLVHQSAVVVPILHADGRLMRLEIVARTHKQSKRAIGFNKRAADYRPSGEREVSAAPQARLDALQAFYSMAKSSGAEVSPFDPEAQGSIRLAIAERRAS